MPKCGEVYAGAASMAAASGLLIIRKKDMLYCIIIQVRIQLSLLVKMDTETEF
jgi:hypothetical protein